MKRMLLGLTMIGALQGCSTIGVDQMTVGNGLVTSAHGGYGFDEVPMTEIRQSDALVVITHVKWDPLAADAGIHEVNWTWYADGKVVAIRKADMRFKKSPFRLFWRIPAADFDPSHYRVEVAIDNKVVDQREYDIVK